MKERIKKMKIQELLKNPKIRIYGRYVNYLGDTGIYKVSFYDVLQGNTPFHYPEDFKEILKSLKNYYEFSEDELRMDLKEENLLIEVIEANAGSDKYLLKDGAWITPRITDPIIFIKNVDIIDNLSEKDYLQIAFPVNLSDVMNKYYNL